MTVLSNGLVEVDGAVDAPTFDRASVEPEVGIAEDDFRVTAAAGTPSLPPETITRVASTTLLSNFVGGNQRQVGGNMAFSFLHMPPFENGNLFVDRRFHTTYYRPS